MSHGQPDFGMYALATNIYRLTDMAELAARLGALPRYDRLGDVLFCEDFEDGIAFWEAETAGTGAAVEWVTTRRVNGGFACKLTAGSDGSMYAGIKGRFPVPFSVISGIEINWTQHDDADYGFIRVDIYTGTYKISFAIKADIATPYNYYLNSAGGWTQISPAVTPYRNDYNFVSMKLTFDVSTQKYSRFLVPPTSYDIEGNSGLVAADTGRPRMEIWGRIYSTAGNNAYSYIDNLILTTNEV